MIQPTVRKVQLTPEQLQAVTRRDGAFVLVAPPGSGKTEVLVQRVIWLLETSAGAVFRVVALTFTHKAAEELRRRVEAAIGRESWRVTATTFHSFALDMLQHYGSSVGIAPDVTIFESDQDRADALLRGLEEDGYLVPAEVTADGLRGLIARIDALKVDLVPPSEAPGARLAELNVTLKDAYAAYESALASMNAIDFSGLLMKANELLIEDEWVAEHYRKLYRYMLIDEAQDSNRAQYFFTRAFCGDSYRNVYIAADADQSIFAFAGASPRFVQQLENELGAERLYLTQNFRSAQTIVSAASRLAQSFQTKSVRRPMVSATLAAGSVDAWKLRDEPAEARKVVGWISTLLTEGLDRDWVYAGEDVQVAPEDISVIGRTRYAFDFVLSELAKQEVPFVVRTDEGGLFDSDLWRAVFYALRVKSNPRDIPSSRRLRSLVPHSELDDESEPGLSAPQLEALLSAISPEAGPDVGSALSDGDLDDISRLVSTLSSIDLGQYLVDEMTRDIWLSDQSRFARWWREYELRSTPERRTLADFLRSLSRLQRTTAEDPGVRILTPYRAKGLEFKAVVVLGMNEGTFPYYRSLGSPEEIDEERRSVYVAVTRAARALLLTRSENQLTRFGTSRLQIQSRFVEELGLTMKSA